VRSKKLRKNFLTFFVKSKKLRRDQGNTPTAKKGPRKHTNCNERTKETHQLQRRDQGNTPTAMKGPRIHTNCKEGTKETHQLPRRDQGDINIIYYLDNPF
jgi:hypothetical protein